MAGRIKKMIEEIITANAKGQQALIYSTRAKLILKGINPDKFDALSPDDPVILQKLELMKKEMGLNI